MLAAAKRPTLYVGVGLRRHGLIELVVRLAQHLRLPLATDALGKAAIPESHPQFAGVYMGVLGDPAVREILDGSDCVIGVVRTDLGSGFWTECINPKSRILIDPEGVRVRFHRYDGLAIRQSVVAVVDRLLASDRPIPRFSGSSIPQLQPEDGEISGVLGFGHQPGCDISSRCRHLRRPAARKSPKDRSVSSDRIDNGTEKTGHTNPTRSEGRWLRPA